MHTLTMLMFAFPFIVLCPVMIVALYGAAMAPSAGDPSAHADYLESRESVQNSLGAEVAKRLAPIGDSMEASAKAHVCNRVPQAVSVIDPVWEAMEALCSVRVNKDHAPGTYSHRWTPIDVVSEAPWEQVA